VSAYAITPLKWRYNGAELTGSKAQHCFSVQIHVAP